MFGQDLRIDAWLTYLPNPAIPSQLIPELRIPWCVISRHRAVEITYTVLALPFGTHFLTASSPHVGQWFLTDVSGIRL